MKIREDFTWGYPLHVEYSLTEEQGRELLQALKIMQHIGIRYLREQRFCVDLYLGQDMRTFSLRRIKQLL